MNKVLAFLRGGKKARTLFLSLNYFCANPVVRPSGFEPETCGLRVHCSAVELEARRDTTTSAPLALLLDGLDLEELFESVLAELAANAGLLVATEGGRGVEGSLSLIHI